MSDIKIPPGRITPWHQTNWDWRAAGNFIGGGTGTGLLTMIVSLEAIFLSCFVLISQTRQSEKDRVRSDIEYEVNVKAELEVAHLHEKTDQIYTHMLERFAQLERKLEKGGAGDRAG